jgi:NADH-quinone oxidoreductase subunit G
VLRVLGNLVEADGFDYVTSDDVLAECRAEVGEVAAGEFKATKTATAGAAKDAADDVDTPLYSVDALVRRARALQLTPAAQRASGEGED